MVEEGQLFSLCWKLIVHLNWELKEDVPDKVNVPEPNRMRIRFRIFYQGNCNVVCPEVEGEVEEDNLDAAAVEVLALRGHQGAKDRVKGEDRDNDQPVQSVHCKELVHQGLQLSHGHLQQNLMLFENMGTKLTHLFNILTLITT